jgi:hypothetical protein
LFERLTRARVVGSVKDASGAVVPRATVTLTNNDKGAIRTTKSNSVTRPPDTRQA